MGDQWCVLRIHWINKINPFVRLKWSRHQERHLEIEDDIKPRSYLWFNHSIFTLTINPICPRSSLGGDFPNTYCCLLSQLLMKGRAAECSNVKIPTGESVQLPSFSKIHLNKQKQKFVARVLSKLTGCSESSRLTRTRFPPSVCLHVMETGYLSWHQLAPPSSQQVRRNSVHSTSGVCSVLWDVPCLRHSTKKKTRTPPRK